MPEDYRDLWEGIRGGPTQADPSGRPVDPERVPESKDELWEYVRDRFGIELPRVAVCDGHDAPLDVLWALISEQSDSVALNANRGGGKSILGALWILLNAEWKPGCECMTVGAIQEQADNVFTHLKRLLRADNDGKPAAEHPNIEELLKKRTTWTNGSEYKIVAASESAVSGPHPQKLHTDEYDLMGSEKRTVFEESRHMPMSKGDIKAQDLLTSSRKYAGGLVQEIMDEVAEAKSRGVKPPYDIYMYCIFEVAANVPNCGNGCGCEKFVKGSWDNGSPRTLADVCGGRLKRSQGWMPLETVQKKFLGVSRNAWESQEECSRPSTEGLVFPGFRRARHCVRGWMPDPEFGRIFMGVDLGYTNPTSVVWGQVLNYDIEALRIYQSPGEEGVVLPAGTVLIFDEIYRANEGTTALVRMVKEREQQWAQAFPGFVVRRRFADAQAAQQIRDWNELGLELESRIKKNVDRDIALVRELIDDGRFVVDIKGAPRLVDEMEAWRFRPGTDVPMKEFDHSIDASRYALSHIKRLGWLDLDSEGRLVPGTEVASLPRAGPPRYQSRGGGVW